MPFGLSARKPGACPRRPGNSSDSSKPKATAQKTELLWAKVFGGEQGRQKRKKGTVATEAEIVEIVAEADAAGSSGSGTASSSRGPPPPGAGVGWDEPDLEWEDCVALRAGAADEMQAVIRMEATDILEGDESAKDAAEQPSGSKGSKGQPKKPLQAPRRLLGICGFDLAPVRGQGSKCYFCQSLIPKQSVRFDYQFSESGKMSRYIHPACCTMIPAANRENSLSFLRKHVDSEVAGEQIQAAINVLSCM